MLLMFPPAAAGIKTTPQCHWGLWALSLLQFLFLAAPLVTGEAMGGSHGAVRLATQKLDSPDIIYCFLAFEVPCVY